MDYVFIRITSPPLWSDLTTIKTMMYKYFTKNNKPVLGTVNKLKQVATTLHSAIGMPSSQVIPSNIYSVWRKVNSRGLLKCLKAVLHLKLEMFSKKYEETF